MNAHAAPLTDLTFLKSFTGNDPEKMKKYINMFLDKAPQQLALLKQHMEAKDWEEVKIIAHSLKPQSGYMGIKSLEQDLRVIEDLAGHQVRLEQLPELVNHVEQILEKAFAELKEFTASF